MNNNRLLNTCVNCKHVFRRSEYDGEEEYFCNSDGSERPICGSMLLDEAFSMHKDGSPKEHGRKNSEVWEKWSYGRHVEVNEVCDLWEAKE